MPARNPNMLTTGAPITSGRYAIRGYISTVTRHGAVVMTAIRDAILGRPWTPPAWAPGCQLQATIFTPSITLSHQWLLHGVVVNVYAAGRRAD
jgi:hypothetical protein